MGVVLYSTIQINFPIDIICCLCKLRLPRGGMGEGERERGREGERDKTILPNSAVLCKSLGFHLFEFKFIISIIPSIISMV